MHPHSAGGVVEVHDADVWLERHPRGCRCGPGDVTQRVGQRRGGLSIEVGTQGLVTVRLPVPMTAKTQHPDMHPATATDDWHVAGDLPIHQGAAQVQKLSLSGNRQPTRQMQCPRCERDGRGQEFAHNVGTLPSGDVKPLAIGAVLCLLTARLALAHPVPFSYVDVHVDKGAVRVTIVAHIFDVAHELAVEPPERLLQPDEAARAAAALTRLLSPRLSISTDGRRVQPAWSAPEILTDRQSLRFMASVSVDRPAVLGVHALLFPYDPNHQTFLNIYEGDVLMSQAILDGRRQDFEYFAGTPQGTAAVIRRFLPAGVHHILVGPDHLLFLIGLLLLGGSMRRLALIVSSFTVAHSITLSLAALNIVTPSPRVVEPAIALSIVYVGVDNLMVRGGRDVRAWIAFAFGFIHGFGFANVLREMDLPARALGWSLFSFNLGVEVGQLAVVAVVATLLALLHSRSEAVSRRLAFVGSIAVMAAGGFWFVQRVFFM
jgi:hydrogenase/urease accessory protein HupE